MLIVGELRDKQMIDQMRDELFNMGIAANTRYSEKDDTYYLTIDEEKDLERAQEYYRVKLGFKKPLELEPEWIKIKTLPRGTTTYAILVVCIVIFLLSYSEMGKRLYDIFFIGKPESGFLYEVLHGQVWRIFTPVLLHLSILHILFNMLWFKDLGYLMEYKFGKNDFLILVFISGITSNLLQYCIGGPSFGGMSGVLYALLGFIWVYKKINGDFDYAIPARDITIMIGWLLLCLTGFLGPIANGAHAGGLFVGMLFALYKVPQKWGRLHFKYFFLALVFLVFTVGIEGLKLGGRYFVLLWT